MISAGTMHTPSPNYRAWALSAGNFPSGGTPMEKLRFLARFGSLAPSVHNSQPWAFSVSQDGIAISPDQSRRLPVADPDGSFLRMSIGMCAENILTVARWLGFSSGLTVDSYGGVALQLQDGASPLRELHPDLVVSRLSDKRPYLDRRVEVDVLQRVAGNAQEGEASCRFVTSSDGMKSVVDAHRRAIVIAASNADFVRELAQLLRANSTRDTRGMPGFVADIGSFASLIVPPFLRVYPLLLRRLVGKEADRVVARSAGFGMILSDRRDALGDVQVGQVYQRTALRLRQAGLVDAMITASVADVAIRQELERALGLKHEIRLLFRFGHPAPGARHHTPREMLTWAKDSSEAGANAHVTRGSQRTISG